MSENSPKAIQDCYDDAFQVCYGCGARNTHGHQLKSYWNGEYAVAEFRPGLEHLGVPGVVYGGLIASLIDCHGIATAAAYFRDRDGTGTPRCVTASLHVDYRKPTPLGDAPLMLKAHVTESSERKAVVEVTLGAAGEDTVKGRVVAVRLPESVQEG